MASKPETGPDTEDRENPGDTRTNPAGASADAPAEGGDDAPSHQPGSPEG
ncbi:hypothetical protein FHS95_002115 [Sphingomonas naasensis]|nr:hypothetical protein [Sphingomonas naasensis]NIJ20423.1 hypothetical protein [Sphingomonas naasensis]